MGRGPAPDRRDDDAVRTWRFVWVASSLVLLGCGSGRGLRIPDSLRDYEIIVTGRDSLGDALSEAFRERGMHVRRAVRGGGPPAAGVVYFDFEEREPTPVRWLHARLFDTRSGVIVAAAMLRLDSIAPDARTRARALVDSLVLGASRPSP